METCSFSQYSGELLNISKPDLEGSIDFFLESDESLPISADEIVENNLDEPSEKNKEEIGSEEPVSSSELFSGASSFSFILIYLILFFQRILVSRKNNIF